MDRSPPPFFKHGPSANARLLLFGLLALGLLIADARFDALGGLRQGIGNVLFPVQRLLLVPRDTLELTTSYFTEVTSLRQDNAELKRIEALNAKALLQIEQLANENKRLRDLAGARERASVQSVLAEVLYETRDPFTRKLVLDKGAQQQVALGQPVIDAKGLVGQVTRVFQFSSEMTLVTDRNMTVPVVLQRTGMRSVAFGGAAPGRMELRYLASSADLKEGDLLTTSGLDALYPPGLPVGRVERIERGGDDDFVKVLIAPTAEIQNNHLLVVLQVDTSAIPPAPPAETIDPARKRNRRSL
ncbi:MAG: rod shape-determining protein MreC [Lautropia sp.]|nr:rod shape-determining protein MreC [Lautropia sp.]